MSSLVLGPILRYVSETEATVWMETDGACRAEVLGVETPTFEVDGHHYALVVIEGLAPGGSLPYEVRLDGRTAWPEPDSKFPPSVIRTIDPDRPLELCFGSCRVSAPHEPPYTLTKDDDGHGYEIDALYALAHRLLSREASGWPDLLVMLGDQVYADELPPGMEDFIRERRNGSEAPMDQVADFEEFSQLYCRAWSEPLIRWLLSTVSIAMIFDDHDVNDDWNISGAWVDDIRREPWWHERIVGAFVSYWVYQHAGNLSPRELAEEGLLAEVQAAEDPAAVLRRHAVKADREAEGTRWSYYRDLGRSRLIVMDSRAGRVVHGKPRKMIDDDEWRWIEEHATGDFDHLLLGTTIPVFLAPGMHHLEAASEALCDGAWGRRMADLVEKLRRAIDLEHWAAFNDSFTRVAGLLRAVGSGERGRAPASITVLSGDVHHAYLAEIGFPPGSGVESGVYQATCSPFRNPLGRAERNIMRGLASYPAHVIGRAIAHLAGVEDPSVRWRYVDDPTFDNQIATIRIDGRSALLRVENTEPGEEDDPRLHLSFEHTLA